MSETIHSGDITFWENRKGIGFSVDSLGRWPEQQRLETALAEVANLGFDTIRTWGTNEYTGRILEAIDRLNLDLKVQAGIYLTVASDANQAINESLNILQPHLNHVIGVSLGNEQLADWNNTGLRVEDVLNHAAIFRNQSDLPITYNFSGETFRDNSSFWPQGGERLLAELDYINVHSYGGFFGNRNNPSWTSERQVSIVDQDGKLFQRILDNFNISEKPLILGETGWQSSGYHPAVTNPVNTEQYFKDISRYIQGSDSEFDGMFYFNFTDESWKGGDDHWGLHQEGDQFGIGAAKFDIDTTTPSPPPTLSLVADSGTASLLVENATGLAYVQRQGQSPLPISRVDSYWQGDIPLTRGEASLIAAAVDDDGQLRVLDSGNTGLFSWILDDNGLFIGEQYPSDVALEDNETLYNLDLDGNGTIGFPEPPSDPTPSLRLITDSGTAALLVDDNTGFAYIQPGQQNPLLISRADSYWQGDIPLTRGDASLIAAAVDDDGQLRVLDSGNTGLFSWILDDNGLFIGEQYPSDVALEDNETLYNLDLDGNGTIGFPEPPSDPTPSLRLITDSGTAALLVDDNTGFAYIQPGQQNPLLISRADSYWQGDIPLTRGDASLIAAAVDDDGQLRVLDSGNTGLFSWILDDSGCFIGEQYPSDVSLEDNERLYNLDLNGNGQVGHPHSDPGDPDIPLEPQRSAYEQTGFNQGEFLSRFQFSHRDTSDPIVAPGNSDFPHAHDFFANRSVNADSTVASMLRAQSSAAVPSNNLSTYWAPSLIDEGRDGLGGEWSYVTPIDSSIAYYSVLRPNEPNQMINMPTGLKMIAGSAKPKERQSRAQIFWNYIGESASYDHIPLGDEWRDLPLQAVVIFPEFWNGKQLDSSNHKSHLAYGNGQGVGPEGHPLLIPQLQLQIHYGKIDNNLHLVTSDYMQLPEPGSDLHLRLARASEEDLSFRNFEAGFAPGWSMHADHIHLPWQETAPNGDKVDGFARREEDALRFPLFAGTDGNAVRPIPTGASQAYSAAEAPMPQLGSPDADTLRGGAGDDRLEALEGDDVLIGSGGGDRLVGADGADRFVMESINDSLINNPDIIVGFSSEDRIDLQALPIEADQLLLSGDSSQGWMITARDTNFGVKVLGEAFDRDQIILEEPLM